MPPSHIDHSLRIRVQRLLRGEFRSDDFTRLFLYARDRCDGRESVQEIGDFVAHHDERTKGLITRTARDWAVIAQYVGWWFSGSGDFSKLDVGALPHFLPEYLQATLRRTENASLKKSNGMIRIKADRFLPKLIKKLERNSDGTYRIRERLENTEAEVLKVLCGSIISKVAFNGAHLFRDFSATLKSHGLLEKGELVNFQRCEIPLSLFAITVMHNCPILISDKITSVLQATYDGKQILVSCSVPSFAKPHNVLLASPLFEVDIINPSQYICSELLDSELWNFALEITPEGRLTVMR